jgi:hypothetical protein
MLILARKVTAVVDVAGVSRVLILIAEVSVGIQTRSQRVLHHGREFCGLTTLMQISTNQSYSPLRSR